MTADGELPICLDDVRAAAARIDGHAHRTPLLTSRTLDARVGAPVLLKAEHLQRAGAFKFRGATNALAALEPAGVCAASSGSPHASAACRRRSSCPPTPRPPSARRPRATAQTS
jgi:threonine dehydratase